MKNSVKLLVLRALSILSVAGCFCAMPLQAANQDDRTRVIAVQNPKAKLTYWTPVMPYPLQAKRSGITGEGGRADEGLKACFRRSVAQRRSAGKEAPAPSAGATVLQTAVDSAVKPYSYL